MAVAADRCSTVVEEIELQQIWTIHNFNLVSKLKPVGQCLLSSYFSDSSKKFTFCLKLYPNGRDSNAQNCVSLVIGTSRLVTVDTSVEYYVSILKASNEAGVVHKSTVYEKIGLDKEVGLRTLVRRDALTKDLLPDGKLTICCKLNVLVLKNKSEVVASSKPNENHFADVGNIIFDSMGFSDVILVVENTKFPAHRAFLAANSEVFAAMFDTKMTEDQTKQVVIEDIKSNAIQEMLRYMYTGKICNLNDIAVELLAAADKYNLNKLKDMCEEALVRLITKENACDIFVLADRHEASNLKKKVVKYINSNAKMVTKTDGWKNITKSHPYLLNKLYCVWANSQ